MFLPNYIIRLDDACPTMDKIKWLKIEQICNKYNIKPIVAVIPNNKDSKLIKDEFDNKFWDKIRNWQKKGWHIALHGYDHVYITKKSGLVPFNNKSEFAGVSYQEQSEKIKKGWKIFKDNNINCNIWVAPAHTFDQNTLKILKKYTDINIISDGISLKPFLKYGFKWIPQQLWHLRKMPFGTWTICLHPNMMNEADFKKLNDFLEENYLYFSNINKINFIKFSFLNILFSKIYWILKRIKNVIKL